MAANKTPVRILHLEDNPTDAHLVQYLLEQARPGLTASIEWVTTKEAYLEALRRGGLDVILSDHRLPDYDGDTALCDAQTVCPNVPFIMVTGELDEERAIGTLLAGATDYVLKDRVKRLVPSIKRALRDAQLQQERREAEQRLIEAQRIARMGSWEWDIQTDTLHWSLEMYSILGVDPASYVPTPGTVFQFFHPDDQRRMREAFEEALAAIGPLQYDSHIVRGDGSVRVVSVIGEVRKRSPEGRALLAAGTCQDITEQKQMEVVVKESEQRFRTMADSTPVMIWVHNAAGEIEMVNRAFEEFFGVKEADIRGPSNWKALVHPEDNEGYVTAFETAFRNRIHFDAEARVKHRSGMWRWVHSVGDPRFSSDGQFLGFVGSSPDITEQKLTIEALRAGEENLRLMVNEAPEAMMILDGHGRIEAVSQLGARLLGYDEGELVGKPADQFAQTFSRLEASLTLEQLRRRPGDPLTTSVRAKTNTGAVELFSLTVRLVNLGPSGEKFVAKFQRLDIPYAWAMQAGGRTAGK